MPLVRRVGNFIFAGFLTMFSSENTASGMRVIQRSSLPKLIPLPDSMHFTPAVGIYDSRSRWNERAHLSNAPALQNPVKGRHCSLEPFLLKPSTLIKKLDKII
jgi:acyl-CoA synthetase (AMP-forming)/AMP-acid ligase II